MVQGQKREVSYDLLRAVSCTEVVILHVASEYVMSENLGIVHAGDWLSASFWRIVTNLAVPSFVMLSGAFLLRSENDNFSAFYGKNLKKILFPTMLFSLLYVIWNYIKIWMTDLLGWGIAISGKDDYLSPLRDWINGHPCVPMWYMYMLIGLYLITPVLVMVKNRISERAYLYLSCAMMVYGICVSYTCTLSWILQFAQWIGYFMLGDVIRQKCRNVTVQNAGREKNKIGILLVILANILLAGYWYLSVFCGEGELQVPASFSGIIVSCTLLQFIGISMLNLQREMFLIKVIAEYSFEIYLIHPIFCMIFGKYYGQIRKSFPTANFLLVYAAVIIFLSLLIARGYRAICGIGTKKQNMRY